jgi:hypothetical protein
MASGTSDIVSEVAKADESVLDSEEQKVEGASDDVAPAPVEETPLQGVCTSPNELKF